MHYFGNQWSDSFCRIRFNVEPIVFNLLDVHEYHLFLFVYLKSGCKNIFQNDFSCGWEEPYSVLLEKTVDNNPTDLFLLPNPKYLDGVIESLLAIR